MSFWFASTKVTGCLLIHDSKTLDIKEDQTGLLVGCSRSDGVRCVKADSLFMFVYGLDSLVVALSRQGAADVMSYFEYKLILLIKVLSFGGDGDEDFFIGEGVVVSSSSLVKSTNSFLGGMMVSLTFLEGLEEEAGMEAMEVEKE
ncbi:hypothetical protein Tco_0908476 [Tanacetum coccineum]|uniref:Uncharacterized protein n=1 Tax=Tanacetum coccineum TaxID=301880 RepID=A0ABQ5CQP7_9ASTR